MESVECLSITFGMTIGESEELQIISIRQNELVSNGHPGGRSRGKGRGEKWTYGDSFLLLSLNLLISPCSTLPPSGQKPPSQKRQHSHYPQQTDYNTGDSSPGEMGSILIWHIRGWGRGR